MIDFEKDGGSVTPNDSVFHFSEKTVRHGFLRKVYAILSAQLLLTTGIVAVFLSAPGLKEYVKSPSGSWIPGISMFGVLVFLLAMACFEKPRRSWPTNIICLLGFTFFESLMLGSITSQYDTHIVLAAAGITALVVFGLTLFALQTKYDFTMMGGVLMVCLFAFIGFGFMAMFIPSQTLQIGISALGAVLFGVYLVFDTQLMLGGRHKYAILLRSTYLQLLTYTLTS
ncbi:hypothetical protein EB796_001252 [Bugula neritina]|uniref:TMBIM6 n=1 Tax=Bugula neritina TaxID=10212 RepID=A0A7J7KQK5_BUGNE|nr:hypothetical protein EB796_001252 [Bugula neritina]